MTRRGFFAVVAGAVVGSHMTVAPAQWTVRAPIVTVPYRKLYARIVISGPVIRASTCQPPGAFMRAMAEDLRRQVVLAERELLESGRHLPRESRQRDASCC